MVGGIGISHTEFYDLSFTDAFLIIEGYEARLEQDFNLNMLAQINAIGLTNKKNFKPTNPFEDVRKQVDNDENKTGSIKERVETFSYLEKMFSTTI